MSLSSKPNNNSNNPPPGVKMEFTSWGVTSNQKPYSNPGITKQEESKKGNNVSKGRPGGGWDDDEDQEPQIKPSGQSTFKSNTSTSVQKNSSGTQPDHPIPSTKKNINPAYEYELVPIDETYIGNHSYEVKVIEDLTLPTGMRLKPSDQQLNEFCKACDSLSIIVVGSLLLGKMQGDSEWISRAKTLCAIETLVKKIKKYYEYFKFNISVLKRLQFEADGQNASKLSTIRDSIVKFIEEPEKSQEKVNFNYIPPADDKDLLDESPSPGKLDPFNLGKSPNCSTSSTTNKLDPFKIGSGGPSQNQINPSVNPIIPNTTQTENKNAQELPDFTQNQSGTASKGPSFIGKFKNKTSSTDVQNMESQNQQENGQKQNNNTPSNANADKFKDFDTHLNFTPDTNSNTQSSTNSTQNIQNSQNGQANELLSLGGVNFLNNQPNPNMQTNFQGFPQQNYPQIGSFPGYPNYQNYPQNFNPNIYQQQYYGQPFNPYGQPQQQLNPQGFNPYGNNNWNQNTQFLQNPQPGTAPTQGLTPEELQKKKEKEAKEKLFDSLY